MRGWGVDGLAARVVMGYLVVKYAEKKLLGDFFSLHISGMIPLGGVPCLASSTCFATTSRSFPLSKNTPSSPFSSSNCYCAGVLPFPAQPRGHQEARGGPAGARLFGEGRRRQEYVSLPGMMPQPALLA